jgi:Flp pilus assembly protein TadG
MMSLRERLRGDRGSLTVAVILWTPLVLVMAGFVVDVGFLISKREHAADLAEQAARRVADDLDLNALRANPPQIVVNNNCDADATSYLHATGDQATLISCAITGNPPGNNPTVTVTIQITTNPLFAGFIRIKDYNVSGTGVAHPIPGG